MATDRATFSDVNAITVGAEIGGFRLLESLTVGGTGSLYRVEALGESPPSFPLIMKIPRVGRDQPAESILSFETESMVLAELHGQSVPRFVAAGDLADFPFLVMEFVEGENLARRVERAPLAEAEVCAVGAAIADAVHELHQQRAIHHDLKPDNITITADGHAVLLDFGFAHHAHLPDLLAEGRRFAAGSAPFISPEQLIGVRDDPRSDLFALGVVLYELATARLPFGIPETAEAMANRRWAAPVPPRVRNAALSPVLQEIILRAIDADSERRYQTAAHLAFDLRHPEQVQLTERATLAERPSFWVQFQRWWDSRDARRRQARKPYVHVSQSPVIMVAVDTTHPDDPRHAALQWTARQLASLNLEFRMLLVTAISTDTQGTNVDPLAASASGRQLAHKVVLQHWVEPLGLPKQRLSLHVIESSEPGEALLLFAKSNNVDLIVLGAPSPDDARLAWWRSTASTITAHAHCSVHVVRVPTRPREDWLPRG